MLAGGSLTCDRLTCAIEFPTSRTRACPGVPVTMIASSCSALRESWRVVVVLWSGSTTRCAVATLYPIASTRNSRGPTGTFNSVNVPPGPVRVPIVMPTSETSAPTIGSPVVTEVTLPSMVPVCAARRVTAGRHSNDAATAIRKDRTRIMIGSPLKQERCGNPHIGFTGGNGTGGQTVSRLAESGRRDSNPRPPGPKPGALPDCATPRLTTKNVEKKTSKELRQDNYVKKTT